MDLDLIDISIVFKGSLGVLRRRGLAKDLDLELVGM